MMVYFLYVRLHAGNEFFRFVGVELEDAPHLYFHQFEDIFLGYFAYELWIIRRQTFVDVFASGIHIFGLFKFLVFINAFFNEDLFQ